MISTLNSHSLAHVKIKGSYTGTWHKENWAQIDSLFGDQMQLPNLQKVEVIMWSGDVRRPEDDPRIGLAMLPLVQTRGILSWSS